MQSRVLIIQTAFYGDVILTLPLVQVLKEKLDAEIDFLCIPKTKIILQNNPYINDVLIFDKSSQDTHSGGSGCACCGTVFSGYLFKQLKEKKIKKLLLIATGALMNSTSSQQGESIPGVAHAISIEL